MKKLNKIKKLVKTSSIDILVFAPFCIGFLLLIVLLAFSIFAEVQTWTRDLVGNLTFFIWGWSGVVMIIKKESPPPWSEKGGMAILHGIIIVIASWSINIIYLFSLFR